MAVTGVLTSLFPMSIGTGAAWHLASIEVEDLSTRKVSTFHCNRWLSKSKGDKQIVRELTSADGRQTSGDCSEQRTSLLHRLNQPSWRRVSALCPSCRSSCLLCSLTIVIVCSLTIVIVCSLTIVIVCSLTIVIVCSLTSDCMLLDYSDCVLIDYAPCL